AQRRLRPSSAAVDAGWWSICQNATYFAADDRRGMRAADQPTATPAGDDCGLRQAGAESTHDACPYHLHSASQSSALRARQQQHQDILAIQHRLDAKSAADVASENVNRFQRNVQQVRDSRAQCKG